MKFKLLFLFLIVIIAFALRFYNISNNPPGLYIDEVANGYDAYSILTTGHDQHGAKYPLWFASLGDYKMPGYIYAIVGSMAIFGKNEFAVRFPSALSGSLTVIIFYFLLQEAVFIVKNKVDLKYLEYLPLLSTFLLAISPWHIQFSRGGFEVTLAVFFYLLALYIFLIFRKSKQFFLLLSSFLLLIMAMYTYQSFRITSPLIVLLLSGYAFFRIPLSIKKLTLALLFCFVLSLPLLQFTFTQHGTARFSEVSAFTEYPISSISGGLKIYPLVFLRNYFSFFSFDFLFNFGDGIGRHQMPNFGVLSRWQLPFLLIGLFFLLRTKNNFLKFSIFALLLIAPIVAAIARPSPHTLRSLPMVISYLIIVALGILFLVEKFKDKKRLFVLCLLGFIILYDLIFYLQFYYVQYPSINILDWGAGYKEIVQTAQAQKSNYSKIIVDNTLSYAPIYFHFYADDIVPIMVPTSWSMPKKWKGLKVLYIRPYYGPTNDKNMIESLRFPNMNHDIYAQFWSIK